MASGQRLQFLEHIAVGQGQAVEDAASDGGIALRARLAALLAEGLNVGGVIAGREKAVVVGVNKGAQRFG